MLLTVPVALLGVLLFSPLVAADARPDGHAPIGVMGDHFHNAGEWMLDYRYMYMDMSAMTMQMHMLGAMYAPTDWLTLMGMLSYLDNSMDMHGGMLGMGSTSMSSSGLGNTQLTALIRIMETDSQRLHAIVGISIPTGSITESQTMQAMDSQNMDMQGMNMQGMAMTHEMRLPYTMQLGSGTWDPKLGLSYAWYNENMSFGAQWTSTFRLGTNDEGYTLGDEHMVTTWIAWLLSDNASFSLRLEGYHRGDVEGHDPAISANPNQQAVDRISAFVGVNYLFDNGFRIAAEVGRPVYQDVDMPHMETDWTATVGLQYSW